MDDTEMPAAARRGARLAEAAETMAVQARELLTEIFADTPEEGRQHLTQTAGLPLLVMATAAGIVTQADGDIEMMNSLQVQAQAHLGVDVSLFHTRRLIQMTRGATFVTEGVEAVQ